MAESAGMPLLTAVLLQPGRVAGLTPMQWDLLIRQGRTANLLGRLARQLLDDETLAPLVPARARHHLDSALRIAARQQMACRWELHCIAEALQDVAEPLVVLKGAAYVALGLPFAATRLFGDVDILVPAERLGAAETALMIKGWAPAELDAYDQQYYRRWMHELPPMHHRRRGTTIDVHHTVLPRSARIKLNTAALFRGLLPLKPWPGLQVLSPAAMVLHSATHLFHEGEFGNGLRDLFDLDALLRHFGAEAAFWPALQDSADALGVSRPLHYALTLTHQVLGTPVPPQAQADAARHAPPWPLSVLVPALYRAALVPVHDSCSGTAQRLAWALLYLRAHWLRMPTLRLLAHLGRKTWRRLSGREAREAEARQRLADGA